MKHVKLFESFLGSEWLYESGVELTSANYSLLTNGLKKLINSVSMQKTILTKINQQLAKVNPQIKKKIGAGEFTGTQTIKSTYLTVSEIDITKAKKSPTGKPIIDTKGTAGFTFSLKGNYKAKLFGSPIDVPITLSIPIGVAFNQQIEIDKLPVPNEVKIYPPIVGVYTPPKSGEIEDIGYVYLSNNKLMYAPEVDEKGNGKDAEQLADLKLQDQVKYCFDATKPNAPYVYAITKEDKKSFFNV